MLFCVNKGNYHGTNAHKDTRNVASHKKVEMDTPPATVEYTINALVGGIRRPVLLAVFLPLQKVLAFVFFTA